MLAVDIPTPASSPIFPSFHQSAVEKPSAGARTKDLRAALSEPNVLYAAAHETNEKIDLNLPWNAPKSKFKELENLSMAPEGMTAMEFINLSKEIVLSINFQEKYVPEDKNQQDEWKDLWTDVDELCIAFDGDLLLGYATRYRRYAEVKSIVIFIEMANAQRRTFGDGKKAFVISLMTLRKMQRIIRAAMEEL